MIERQILRTPPSLLLPPAESETADDGAHKSSRKTAMEEQRTKFSPYKKSEATLERERQRGEKELEWTETGHPKQAQEKYT